MLSVVLSILYPDVQDDVQSIGIVKSEGARLMAHPELWDLQTRAQHEPKRGRSPCSIFVQSTVQAEPHEISLIHASQHRIKDSDHMIGSVDAIDYSSRSSGSSVHHLFLQSDGR